MQRRSRSSAGAGTSWRASGTSVPKSIKVRVIASGLELHPSSTRNIEASALYVKHTIGLACALGKYHVLGYGVRFSSYIMVSGFPFGGEGTQWSCGSGSSNGSNRKESPFTYPSIEL